MKRKGKPKLPDEYRRHKVTITLSYEARQYLKSRYNKSVTVDKALTGSKGFREWKAEQERIKEGGVEPILV